MAQRTLSVRQKQKYDTSTNWATNNPVLLAGEIGIESDTHKMKAGDGVTAWNSLGYISIPYTETDPTVPSWAKQANKPTYDYSEIANTPTIPTVNDATLTLQLNGSQIDTFSANASANKTINVQALPNYSINIGSTNGGNPRQVLFTRVNYTNFDSNSGAYFKLGAMSGHGNGSSYTFVEDVFINVNYQGTVTCNVYKYVQQSVTLDGVTRNYGDIFWTIDTTNKIVDFYILLGQYSSAQFTPATKIGAAKAVTTANGITQYSGTPTYYSSGTKAWATGNSTLYARLSDIPDTSNFLTIGNENQTVTGYKVFNLLTCYRDNVDHPLSIKTALTNCFIDFKSSSGKTLGFLGVSETKEPIFYAGDGNIETLAYASDLLSKVYPVGSIYMSQKPKSPASFLGGTWTALDGDTVLWTQAWTSNTTTEFSVNASGSKISAGLPDHRHLIASEGRHGMNGNSGNAYYADGNSKSRTGNMYTNYASSHNSIYGNSSTVQPPAQKVYAWRRTA